MQETFHRHEGLIRGAIFLDLNTFPEPSNSNREPTQHQALLAARQRENTKEYKVEYARRAGIEGTISQGVRAYGLRRAKYIGLAKTHLQHVLSATAKLTIGC